MADMATMQDNVVTFALLDHVCEEVIKELKKDAPFDQQKASTVVFNTIVMTAKREAK